MMDVVVYSTGRTVTEFVRPGVPELIVPWHSHSGVWPARAPAYVLGLGQDAGSPALREPPRGVQPRDPTAQNDDVGRNAPGKTGQYRPREIGRASCRERVCQ